MTGVVNNGWLAALSLHRAKTWMDSGLAHWDACMQAVWCRLLGTTDKGTTGSGVPWIVDLQCMAQVRVVLF